MFEQIIFFDGSSADEYLETLEEHGPEAVLQSFLEYHDPGKHPVTQVSSSGTDDTIHQSGNYFLHYNWRLNYIGLEYDLTNHET